MMKRLWLGLLVLMLMVTACAPAPTPPALVGIPLAAGTPATAAIPVETLPAIGIRTPTSPPQPIPITRISILQAHGGRVNWLDSKNILAFDQTGKDGYDDIYSVNLDGSNLVCLTCKKRDLPQKHNGNPDWNPNGDYLAFQSEEPDYRLTGQPLGEFMASPNQGINNNIWIMNADGSRFWQITNVVPMNGALHPHFSPDGNQLVWAEMIDSTGIGQWVMKLADFSLYKGRPLVNKIQTLSPLSLQWYEPHGFSPDLSRIIFSGVPKGKWFFDSEIYTYNLDSHVSERLTNNNDWDEYARFSPDGKWIAWVSSSDIPQPRTTSLADMVTQPLKTDVWIMSPDGSHKQRLTRFNDPNALEGGHAPVGVTCGDISWGPDGKSLAVEIQVGAEQSIVLVQFDPATLAQ